MLGCGYLYQPMCAECVIDWWCVRMRILWNVTYIQDLCVGVCVCCVCFMNGGVCVCDDEIYNRT